MNIYTRIYTRESEKTYEVTSEVFCMQLNCYPEIKKESSLPIYVTGLGIDCAQNSATGPIPKQPHIIVTVSGRGIVSVNGESYEMAPGSALYIGRDMMYDCSALTRNWLINWVSFEYGSGMEGFASELFTSQDVFYFERRVSSEPDGMIRSMYDSLSSDELYGGFTASAAMYRLLIILNRAAEAIPDSKEKVNPVVAAAIDYINEHYAEEITLDDLCSVGGGLSEQYLCRLFKQATGLRPVEYILKKRISVARAYLEETDMPISEAAEKTGFHNTSYFYRNFKKFTGTSPLACRQNAARALSD